LLHLLPTNNTPVRNSTCTTEDLRPCVRMGGKGISIVLLTIGTAAASGGSPRAHLKAISAVKSIPETQTSSLEIIRWPPALDSYKDCNTTLFSNFDQI
jgi:hypothetical protein